MNKTSEKTLVFITDLITINIAWIIYRQLRLTTGWFDFLVEPELFFPMFVVYFYWIVIFTMVGMYRTWFALSRFDELSTLFKSTFVGIFILFFLIMFDDYQSGVSSTNRFLIFFYWGIFFALVGTGRLFIRSLQRQLLIKGIGRRNVLLVGFNEKGFEVQEQVTNHRALGLDIIGYVAVQDENIGKENNGIKAIGHVSQISEIIKNYNVQEVILSLRNHHEDILIEVIAKCENLNIGIKIVPDLYDILSGQAKTSQLYGVPLIDINPILMPEWEKRAKRILDIVVSLILLVCSAPMTLATAIAIKLDSKGPILFKQERCGLNGKLFNVYKFRSMYIDAEKNTGPVWSFKNDPRITKIGRLIRKIRVDEIPQMINVLKGEMSLVGPRPERPFFVEKLSKEIPYYKRRLKVKPGLTGWAQVKHKYDETIDDVKKKLKYDLFYIENMSLRMDLKILFRTIFVVLFGKGHYD